MMNRWTDEQCFCFFGLIRPLKNIFPLKSKGEMSIYWDNIWAAGYMESRWWKRIAILYSIFWEGREQSQKE